jgi:predicted nucleotidyltransferase
MTATLLDFSQRRELTLHASIAAAIEAAAAPLGVEILIVGAFARDLHLLYRYGVHMQRETKDIDFALAVADWNTFETLKRKLIASGDFIESQSPHRLRHRSQLPVDLVPFGKVERADRRVAWPPDGDVVMDVFGFREALAAAQDVVLPGNVRTKVVSLHALALLKLVCWQERHATSPRKDAQDLHLILRNYLDAGNADRLWDEFIGWTADEKFEAELAGPRMLGHDVCLLLNNDGIRRVEGILLDETQSSPSVLPNQMNADDPSRAEALLAAMLRGLQENRRT